MYSCCGYEVFVDECNDQWTSLIEEEPPSPAETDRDAYGLDECSREGSELGICTEGLGSESCEIEVDEEPGMSTAAEVGKERRCGREKTQRREFPPPMQWVGAPKGRLMSAERKEGRLILRQVRVERAAFLRASREDGRLRLYPVELVPVALADEEKQTAEVPAEEGGERWEWRMMGDQRWRCNGAVASGTSTVPFWDYRYATMA